MAHAELSRLDDWHLVNPEQDIRGWKIVDASGTTLGRVDDLLVSTDTELVELIKLDTGEEYAAKDIEIGDRVVYLRGQRPAAVETTEPVVKVYDNARIHRRQNEGGEWWGTTPEHYNRYEDDFRGHYTSTYGTTGADWTKYAPAYRYGYASAFAEPHRGREWAAAEPDLRRDYEKRHGTGSWDRVQGAVGHAFKRGRTHRT